MTINARANDLHNTLNANNVAFFFANEFISEMDFLINEMLIDNDDEDRGYVNDAFFLSSIFIDKKIDDAWDNDDSAKQLNIALTMTFNTASLAVIEFIRENHFDIAMALMPIANRCINSTLFDRKHNNECECEVCINNEWSNSNRAKAGK